MRREFGEHSGEKIKASSFGCFEKAELKEEFIKKFARFDLLGRFMANSWSCMGTLL